MIRGLNKITEAAGLGYVMSSYTSHPEGNEAAATQAVHIAAELSLAGLVVFVPIAYGTAIEKRMLDILECPATPGDKDYIQSHEFWMAMDERFYQRCDYGLLAMTPGWNKSTGIAIEFFALARAGVPIHFLDVDNWHVYNIGEAGQKWPDEFQDLLQKATKTGAPRYLAENVASQSKLLAKDITEAMFEDLLWLKIPSTSQGL